MLKKIPITSDVLLHKPQDTCFQSELHEPQAATIAFQVAQ